MLELARQHPRYGYRRITALLRQEGWQVNRKRVQRLEPGSPWENAYSESFNSRFRDELLDREIFTRVMEAKVLVRDYKQEYNQGRPHSALNYQTPAAFAATVRQAKKAALGKLT